ncbi:lectin like domain-containing protein [Maridesulfovibrio bastinii]|uniref:lectin like domain-containing protein n=1 Tax=Maridesulfovibrio bastinii TaxID=47157 RepID=UPI000413EF8B|nr:lectin like domain-containing protein [Maridesulfovibrio bastinii]
MRFISLFIALIMLFPMSAYAAELLPLNPDFVKWQQQQDAQQKNSSTTAVNKKYSSIPPLTARPSPINREYLKNISIVPAKTTKAIEPSETYFDLRDSGYVSPIRDQNPYGDCWAFAAMGSMESSALRHGMNPADFSEKHLAYFTYTDIDQNRIGYDKASQETSIYDLGGNEDQAFAMISRGTGAVSEADEPYTNMDTPPSADAKNVSALDAVIQAPGGDSVVANIKYLLKNYGAVDVSIYYDDSYFNEENYSFYNKVNTNTNHAVTIVGWDDSYSKYNFNTTPENNGAWIVRNSWGTWWGGNGYFYVSYEEAAICEDGGVAFIARKADSKEFIYMYDYLGQTIEMATGNNSPLFTANIFTAVKNQNLKKAVLFALTPENSYTIYIYKDVTDNNPSSGTLTYQSDTLNFEAPGVYTLDLAKNIPVEKGEKFSIVLKTESETKPNYCALESPINNYTSKATAAKGQSFYRTTGTTWGDITNMYDNTNICLRVIAVPATHSMAPINSLLLN